jgi:FkbM family methyltransferase
MQALKHCLRVSARKAGYLLAHSSRIGVELENDLCRLSQQDPLSTILDVGANHGTTAIRFTRAFPQAQIFCFEPVSANFKILSRTCSRHSKIVPLQKGLSDKPGMERIGLTSHPYGHSLLLSSVADQTEQVALTTLDIFATEHNLDRIDLLKIDVEGMEIAVLNGAHAALKSSLIRFIYAECITVPDAIAPHTLFADLSSFLLPHGFVVFAFYHEAFHLAAGSALVNVLYVNRKYLPKMVAGAVQNIF